jgi:imidazolonepropionase-like amidohydrolase
MLRDTLVKAGEYSARASAASDDSPAPRDLGMEALAAMLDGRMPARVEATAPSHIRSALAVAEEFDLPLIIEGGTGASAMRYELARRGVPVILGPTSAPFPTGGEIASPEDYPIIDERTAALLADAGVPFAIASYSEALGDLTEPLGGKFLLVEAALATGYGLSDGEALRAVTLYPAQILGIDHRVGSLEPGKDADLVILPGPPLDTMSRVEHVFVDGTLVYELAAD